MLDNDQDNDLDDDEEDKDRDNDQRNRRYTFSVPLTPILCPSYTDALWCLNVTAWPEYRLQPEAKKGLQARLNTAVIGAEASGLLPPEGWTPTRGDRNQAGLQRDKP